MLYFYTLFYYDIYVLTIKYVYIVNGIIYESLKSVNACLKNQCNLTYNSLKLHYWGGKISITLNCLIF